MEYFFEIGSNQYLPSINPFFIDGKKVWCPSTGINGNHLEFVRRLNPLSIASFDPSKATLGARLRYLRRRAKVTIAQLATRSKISHNTISRLERTPDRRANPAILEKILQVLRLIFQEISPGAGDCYDRLVPPKTPGSWIKNARLKKGLQQKALAKRLGVSRETVRRWERDLVRPGTNVQNHLNEVLGPTASFPVSR